MVCFLVGFVARLFHVGFVEEGREQMVMVICFGNVPFLLSLRFVKILKIHDLMRMDQGHWPRCLLWHGWLPMLSGVNGASPWAASADDSAGYLVETALGGYSSGLIAEWGLPGEFDAVEAASLLPDRPNVWTDGSLVHGRVTGVSSSGAGFFCSSACHLLGSSVLGSCWSGSPSW